MTLIKGWFICLVWVGLIPDMSKLGFCYKGSNEPEAEIKKTNELHVVIFLKSPSTIIMFYRNEDKVKV